MTWDIDAKSCRRHLMSGVGPGCRSFYIGKAAGGEDVIDGMIVTGGIGPGPVSRDDKRIVFGVGPARPCGFWFRVFGSQFVLFRVCVIALMTREPRDHGIIFCGIDPSAELGCCVASSRVVPIPNVVAEIGDGVEDKPEGNKVEGDRNVVHGN